ncbi:leukocyte antigen CD37 isoform X1 [Mesocricetus auratus]|uniref:Leukocyte antigen CD37 n=2 Tax=Mesocricetus auratus TaxID=10036 RepID=A0A3Q0DAI7_MESAU|nr:leukocyte antigen CD37 isoform X1 [Mesocricetus auratus]
MDTREEPPIVSLVPTCSKDPQVKMSAQESCLSLIKYFLFVFNLFFFVLGGLIFCFGTWILIDKTSFVSFVGLSFVPLQTWSKVLAVSGVLTMALALLGCVGALKELRCLLGLYFGMLLLLFATQITLGILISTQRIRLERRVQELVLQTIHSYRANPDETAAEESWDYAQFQLRCCGWYSPRDWISARTLRGNESEEPLVPCSCYNSTAANDSLGFDKLFFSQLSRLGPRAKLRQTADLCALPAKAHIYREGCAQSLRKWLHNNLISIVGICLGVGLLEVSGMALCLQLHRRALSREPVLPLPGAEARLHDALNIPV